MVVGGGSGSKNVIQMLNKDGTIRWSSETLIATIGLNGKKITDSTILYAGYGRPNDSSLLSVKSPIAIEIDTLGNILRSTYFSYPEVNFELQFSGFPIPLLWGNSVINSAAGDMLFATHGVDTTTKDSSIYFTNIPNDWSKSTCFELKQIRPTKPFTPNFLSMDTSLPKPVNAVIRDLNVQINSIITPYDTVCYMPNPPFSLGADTMLCPGETVTLKGPVANGYLWNTGDTTQQITVDSPGWYTLTTTYPCFKNTVTDSILVEFSPDYNPSIQLNKPFYFENDRLIANGSFTGGGDYRWYVDGILKDSIREFRLTTDSLGRYTLKLEYTDDNGCFYTDSVEYIVRYPVPKVPNVFTPNGDGVNDLFKLLGAEGLSYSFQIFNRNGTLVYQSNNQPWDGQTLQGNLAAAGVYFYVISYQDMAEPLRGNVTLVR